MKKKSNKNTIYSKKFIKKKKKQENIFKILKTYFYRIHSMRAIFLLKIAINILFYNS